MVALAGSASDFLVAFDGSASDFFDALAGSANDFEEFEAGPARELVLLAGSVTEARELTLTSYFTDASVFFTFLRTGDFAKFSRISSDSVL